ncbi:MAG: helix-turn-helix domain-containing protein [Egibacteraceae bacterium]
MGDATIVPEPPEKPEEFGRFRHIDLDAEQVTTLAHPIRSRLLTALRKGGPATSTMLALRLGTNSGTTSYHLRKLADAGLVRDAPEFGDGRDRWWQAAQDSHSYRSQRFADDPDALAAADWLYAHYLRHSQRMAEDWLETRYSWPSEWRDASSMSDFVLHLTPAALEELNTELEAVIRRWRDETDPGLPNAKKVVVLLHDFPVAE